MATTKVITGALIRIVATPAGGKPVTIGRAMSMNVSETYAVRPIYGIGAFVPSELTILQWSGQLSLSLFAIPSTDNILNQFSKKGTVSQVINAILFTEGVDVVISRRVKGSDSTTDDFVDVASINGCVCQNESFSIQEGNIVERSGSFVFSSPVSFIG